MGRVTTPKYRLEYRESFVYADTGRTGMRTRTQAWEHRRPNATNSRAHQTLGKPTPDNIRKYLVALNLSYQPGGSGWKISESLGYIPTIFSGKVVEQATGEIVAEYDFGPFLAF